MALQSLHLSLETLRRMIDFEWTDFLRAFHAISDAASMDRFLEEPIPAETMGSLFGQLVQNFQDNLEDALHYKLLGFPWEEDKPGTHHHFVWNLHGAGILLITRLNGSCYVLAMNHLCLRTGLGSQARSSPKQPSSQSDAAKLR